MQINRILIPETCKFYHYVMQYSEISSGKCVSNPVENLHQQGARIGQLADAINWDAVEDEFIRQLLYKAKPGNKFRRRAGIEPVIGHIKHDHLMQRNYLKGILGVANLARTRS